MANTTKLEKKRPWHSRIKSQAANIHCLLVVAHQSCAASLHQAPAQGPLNIASSWHLVKTFFPSNITRTRIVNRHRNVVEK
jgi:hypothetical protein